MSATLAAAVIHHRHYPEVITTLKSLVEAGIPPEALLVIDNSEDEETAEALRSTSEGWQVEVVENRGYGAAANLALRKCSGAKYLLLATHETVIDARSVRALADALTADPGVAAAGPDTLMTTGDRVWSRGGVLSPHLQMPRHLLDDDDLPGGDDTRDVQWLDGACVMYRMEALQQNPFREDFFLYFEETELHTRLRRSGWRVVAAPGATAYQSSEGMPSYWGCRNIFLFQATHGSTTSRLVGPVYFTARTMVVSLLGGDWADVVAALRGLVAGYRAVRSGTT